MGTVSGTGRVGDVWLWKPLCGPPLQLALCRWGGEKVSKECTGLGQFSAVSLHSSDSRNDN